MKLKASPGDFVVEEESSTRLSAEPGRFAVYQLSKSSWDTFDLLDLLARRWKVPRENIGLGGFKDRHGSTVQRISVSGLSGRPLSIREKNFSARFLGWSDAPVTARSIRGNRFRITLRDLAEGEVRLIASNAAEVTRVGIPNYYDAQRFGSARHGKGFMGKEIFLGRRERALRLFFTPSRHDDRRTRALKSCVLANWGHWERCAAMGFGDYGRVIACLVEHRGAFHKALGRIDRRFLVFAVNAYQSFLFNGLLCRWLVELAARRRAELTPLRSPLGVLQFHRSLPRQMEEELSAAILPVPGYDTVCTDPQILRALMAVLAEERVQLSDLRVRQMRGLRVGGAQRSAVVVPQNFSCSEPVADERYPGRRKMQLQFFLPRGSYATLLVKRLLLAPVGSGEATGAGPSPVG